MKKQVFLIFMTFMLLFSACVPLERQAICRKGICYGRTKQSFIYKFWNYYRRGISFEDGGILAFNEGDYQMAERLFHSAMLDFQEALSRCTEPGFDIFTQGARTIETYFPYRELGVVKYYLARIQFINESAKLIKDTRIVKQIIQQSMQDLKTSIYGDFFKPHENTGIDTERGRNYLKKARQFWFKDLKQTSLPEIFISAIGKQTIPQQDNAPPEITLKTPACEHHLTYLDEIMIEGTISDPAGIKRTDISVDEDKEKPVHSVQESVDNKQDQIFFSKKIYLDVGINIVSIHAFDAFNNQSIYTINITRQKMDFLPNTSRLLLKIDAFTKQMASKMTEPDENTDPMKWTENFESDLETQMHRYPRFNASSYKNIENMAPLVDCQLTGNIVEWTDGIEINARLIHTKTSDIMAPVSVFLENVPDQRVLTKKKLDQFYQSINHELASKWPVLKGFLRKVEKKRVEIQFDFHCQADPKMGGIIFPINTLVHQLHNNNAVEAGRFSLFQTQKDIAIGNILSINQPIIEKMPVITH